MTDAIAGSDESQDNRSGRSSESTGSFVSLKSLSHLTGFPTDFIKEELLLDKDEVSVENLRDSVLNYLESINKPS